MNTDLHEDPSSKRTDSDGPGTALTLLIPAAVGLFLALPTLRSYFVADDFVSLYSVTVTPPWRYLYSNWLGAIGEGGFYRPVFNWVLGLCYLPAGLNPVPFRIALIGLFAANCALVSSLTYRATASRAGAVLAGLFFAALPAHAESIGWISSLLEQLCALFFLLCIRAVDQGHTVRAVVLMALSLGSKEMGIAIPPVALAWVLFLRRESRSWRETIPLFLLAGAYVAFRLAILGGVGGYGDRHLRLGMIDNNLVHYIYFLLEPIPTPWLDRGAGGKALAVVAAGIIGAWGLWRVAGLPRCRGAGVGLLWFFFAWMPVATLLRSQYLFQPSVGIALALGAILGPLLDEARRKERTGLSAILCLGSLLWVLSAGNALLSHLKQWERGGQIAQGVLEQSATLLRDAPPGQMVFYQGLPVNIGVPVFQHGMAEGLRLYLRRADIAADRVQTFDSIPAAIDANRARFFRYDGTTLQDRTLEERARRTAAK